MGELLYPHNARAYSQAAAMLEARGRAAVIHPTGTGKSFIGLQLCADHPERVVRWLSPSEYIFQTQLENWRRVGGPELENIRFCTYAKLSQLSGEELSAFKQDYIVLDEFHRCGARMWGKQVRELLEGSPGARALGLSATSVRYLDNRRDMACELFGGNIASEMSLGEAIALGILRRPKYIQSVYGYEKSLKEYDRRIRGLKSEAARDEAWRRLEALRRALEQAEGLEEVFQKHMGDRRGRYLVFCANARHMDQMIARVPEWFGGIDASPHVYRAYAEDRETRRTFARFQEDGSEHLKLLFCIDMFNEGIHVEDLAGVILFRPTVSPIIYKQQIGRALSAGGAEEPVIFDVVNNVENLYSVGALAREVSGAAVSLRAEGERVEQDRFPISDEVKNCRELFERLEESLNVPWEAMYRCAQAYYREHGDLKVPRRYRTAEGYALGNWVLTQRRVRAGSQYGKLDGDRIERLDRIGMIWEERSSADWEEVYAALREYREEHGDLDVPAGYETASGLKLGRYVSALRSRRARGGAEPDEERIRQLDALGMIWDKADRQWERYYQGCAAYYREHGTLRMESDYVSSDGLKLGAWLYRQRRARSGRGPARLTGDQIRRLNEIGMEWEDAYTRQWEYGYGQAEKWHRVHRDLEVPPTYVDEDGFALGKWIKRHREAASAARRGTIQLTPERRARLDALGMRWEKKPDPWESRYALARAYYQEHGNLRVPPGYRPDGIWLGKWLNEQKQVYRGNRAGKALTREQIGKLEEIGIIWTSPRPHKPAASEHRGAAGSCVISDRRQTG